MPRVYRHWTCQSDATGPTGAQNLSTALQGMWGQGTHRVAALSGVKIIHKGIIMKTLLRSFIVIVGVGVAYAED